MSDAEIKITVEEDPASTVVASVTAEAAAVLKPVGDRAEGEDPGTDVAITVPSVTAEAAAVLKPVGDTADAQAKEEASQVDRAHHRARPAEWIFQMRTFLMLLATVVATVTFHAGLSPPKGFWPDSRDGHFAGESVFLSTHPKSFGYFKLCDGLSFFTSLVILLLLVYDCFYRTQTKMTALIIIAVVDLSLLVCAFVFGTCPEHPLNGLWYLIYAVTICATIFLAVYLVRALWRDAEKQPRKRAKRAKSI